MMYMISVTTKTKKRICFVRPTKTMVKRDFAVWSEFTDLENSGWALYGRDGTMEDSGGLPQIALPRAVECHTRWDVSYFPIYS